MSTSSAVTAQRAERVERLADEPLLVVALQISGGHVVDQGVSPYVVERVGFGHLGGALADDHADLPFVVQRGSDVGVWVDGIAGGDDRGGGLGEHRRVLRQVLSVGAAGRVEAAGRELGGMLGVILADAEDVAVRDERREQLARFGGRCRVQPGYRAGAGGDDLLQAANRGAGVGEGHRASGAVLTYCADPWALCVIDSCKPHVTNLR
jgi:hypothetical protein